MSDLLKQAALKLAKKDPVFRRALVAAMTDGSVRAFLMLLGPEFTQRANASEFVRIVAGQEPVDDSGQAARIIASAEDLLR